MKFLIVGINYSPELTGCGPYTFDLAQALGKAGHEVIVICGLPHYPSWTVPEQFRGKRQTTGYEHGVLVKRLWHWVPRKNSTIGRIFYELTFGLHAFVVSLNTKVDVCIVVSPSLLSALSGLLVRRQSGAIFKILIQDLVAASVRQQISVLPFFIKNIISRLEKFLLQRADSIGIISPGFTQELEKFEIIREKIALTENYSLAEATNQSYEQAREKWGWIPEDKIVLYSGSIGSKQNLENLVLATKVLNESDSKIKVVIVGDGPEKEKIMELGSQLPNLHFRNLVPVQDYPTLLAGADLLIVHEGPVGEQSSLPSKLFTYVSANRPMLVVASEASGAYQFAQKKNIETCPPGQPGLLCESIRKCLRMESGLEPKASESYDARAFRVNWALNIDSFTHD